MGLPGDPDPEPSLSDLLNKSNPSNDTNLSQSKKKTRDRKKKRQKLTKQYLSDPSSSDKSDSSEDIDYRRKRLKRKSILSNYAHVQWKSC